ncbi:MAG: DUF1592 domain-containing protein [Verrucomicrobiales bacterium]
MRIFLSALIFSALNGVSATAETTAVAEHVDSFLVKYCLDCHDADSEKGDINLDFLKIDWSDPHAAKVWGKAWDMLESGSMPPEDKAQPSAEERAAVVAWLGAELLKHDRPGGTVLRRLSKEEYENSVSDVLKIPFEVPESFPADMANHGFDNNGEDLVLSPPLMAQYLEIATAAADSVLPPPVEQRRLKKETKLIGPGDFTLSFTTGHEIDGVLRMALSSDPLGRASVWPNRFEAKVPGVYQVKIDLSAFKVGDDHVPVVHLLAHTSDGNNYAKANSLELLAEFTVSDDKPKTFQTEVELQRGETIVVHYENAPLSSDQDKGRKWLPRLAEQLTDMFRANPELGAAWMKAGYQRSDRGWNWLERIEAVRKKGGLDVEGFDPDSPEVKEFALKMARQSVNLVETMSCYRFSTGPCIDIHRMSVTGPLRLIDDEEEIAQQKITERFLGEREGRNDQDYAEAILSPLLDKAFRRPVTEAQLRKYVRIAIKHQEAGHRFEDGLHLAVRAVLCSPNFLYRGQREGQLDDFDLASRLSYFLTSSPPDATLWKLASSGELSDPTILEAQTRRLLKHNQVKNFLSSFTGQWLDLRLLPDIMPDTRLLNWNDKDLKAVTDETELFVAEILRKNHPIETFIDPDFTYLNKRNAKLYGIKHPNSDAMKRVQIERGGRRGGILTQASVMMATANGVDTQPVLRGVWLLENILGDPVPEPPSNIPAVEPDTSGATSIRDLLERHTADASCAGCHKKIDPPGFALENFDPVGRWRDHYPVYEKVGDKVVRKDGLAVDALGTLHDGTKLRDVTDLKRYLVENIDVFGNCLAKKLLIYATGRDLGFGDRQEVESIVKAVREEGNGFQDLIVALVLGEAFRSK